MVKYILCAASAKSLQSYPILCDPIDSSQPGSSVPGILQIRIVEWVAISFSNACMHAKSLQSCPTLCDPMDSNPPGSSRQEFWSGLPFPSSIYYIKFTIFKYVHIVGQPSSPASSELYLAKLKLKTH